MVEEARQAATVASSVGVNVTSALTVAAVLGLFSLQGRVNTVEVELKSTTLVAQAASHDAEDLGRQTVGVKQQVEGLRSDVARIEQTVKEQGQRAAEDRALILEKLGRLDGARNNDNDARR